jgi:hypothetical protein
MNKKVLVIAVTLMVVAMLALLVSTVYAIKPETMTLSGSTYVIGSGTQRSFDAGESGSELIKFKDLPVVFTGDIIAGDLGTLTPGGVCDTNWLVKEPLVDWVFTGTFTLQDATIAGIGTGDLKIGMLFKDGMSAARWTIESGTGDLSSIRGRGTALQVGMYKYNYEFEVQINP